MGAFNDSPVADLTTAEVTLEKPFSDSQGSFSTVVLKHTEPYSTSATNKVFPLAVECQGFEVLASCEVPTIISSSTGVSLPKVYYEDTDNHVVIMYDCGEGCITLKDYLKFHPVPLKVARRISGALGHFPGELHINSHNWRPADWPGVLLKHKFNDNIQVRDISASITYGVIQRDLPRTTERYDKVITLLGNMHDKIKTTNEVLVMGDFWTANILVYGKSMEKLSVVDWELSKPGLAGLDVGQFLAEVYTVQRFHPSS